MKFAILAALAQELLFFKKKGKASLLPTPRAGQCRFTRWHDTDGTLILLAVSGIGTVAAAKATTLLIERFQITHLLNIGTAGWLKQTPPPTLILGQNTGYSDVDLTPFGYEHGELPGLPKRFAADAQLLEAALTFPDASAHRGTICSGDRFIGSHDRRTQLQQSCPEADAVDMESAACAHICHDYGLPFLSIRTLSDDADDTAAAQYRTTEGAAHVAATVALHVVKLFLQKKAQHAPRAEAALL